MPVVLALLQALRLGVRLENTVLVALRLLLADTQAVAVLVGGALAEPERQLLTDCVRLRVWLAVPVLLALAQRVGLALLLGLRVSPPILAPPEGLSVPDTLGLGVEVEEALRLARLLALRVGEEDTLGLPLPLLLALGLPLVVEVPLAVGEAEGQRLPQRWCA